MNLDKHHEFYKKVYVHRITVGSLVINKSNQLLLLKELRQYGENMVLNYSIPGGTLEKGEAIVDGVMREVKEETNLEINVLGIIGIANWERSAQRHPTDPYTHNGTDIVFVSRVTGGEFKPQTKEEILSGEWFDPDQISSLEDKLEPSEFRPKNNLRNIEKMYESYLANQYLKYEDVSGYNHFSVRSEFT